MLNVLLVKNRIFHIRFGVQLINLENATKSTSSPVTSSSATSTTTAATHIEHSFLFILGNLFLLS